MRTFYNFLVFTLCLNLSAYILPFFIALPVKSPLVYDPLSISSVFSVEVFAFLTVVSAATGVVALLLRAGTYAIYALIVEVVGILLPITRNFLLAVPILLNAIMPPEMNPIYPAPNPISLVVTAIMTFAGFWFFMELVMQRNIT